MAVFLAPLLPFALRWGARALVVGGVTWIGARVYQNDGNVPKAFNVLREDVVHGYKFVTDEQYRKLQQAGDRLYAKGGEYANFASLLLALAETISGSNLGNATKALTKVQAILAAYVAFDAKRKNDIKNETGFDVEALMHDALARLMYTKGIEMVNDTNVTHLSIAQYLQHQYLGLYYIGRSGNHLGAEEVDSRAMHLRHLHHQAGPRKYKALVTWFETVGVSYPGALLPLLQACDLIKNLQVDPRYIAHALNQRDATLSFDGILEDLLNRLPS